MNSTPFSTSTQISTDDRAEYHGISVAETSGSATAQVKVFSGTDNTGDLIEIVNLAANESAREWNHEGVGADGIYVEVTSGAVEGALRWAK